MIATEEKEDEWPICPHCKSELRKLWFQELKKDLGKRCLYFCPECRSCLGISHRKGLTMGL
jgi:uncharacterized protein with PIN domain